MLGNVSHAHNTYLVVGGREDAIKLCYDAAKLLEVPTRGNPDFWHGTYTQFTIDESRVLKELRSQKAYGERRIFLIETITMTGDAQQALLKLCEDLTETMYLFLVVPTAEQILPTLRSRFVQIRMTTDGDETKKHFLGLEWKERAAELQPILKNHDTGAAWALLSQIEQDLHPRVRLKHYEDAPILARVVEAKRRLLGGVVPLKMILEEIAATLPVVKL